jgi:hypothetical protein
MSCAAFTGPHNAPSPSCAVRVFPALRSRQRFAARPMHGLRSLSHHLSQRPWRTASGQPPPMPPTNRTDQLQSLLLAVRRAVLCQEVRSLALLAHGRRQSLAARVSAPTNGWPPTPTTRQGAPIPAGASWVCRLRQPEPSEATLQRPKPEPGRCSTTGPDQQGGGSGAWQLLSPNAATTRPPMTGGAPSGTTVPEPVKKTTEKRLHRYDPAAIQA